MIRQLMLSQLRVMFREPGVLFWVFGFPILMSWILGVAFSGDGKKNLTLPWVGPETYLEELARSGHLTQEEGGWRLEVWGPSQETLHFRPMDDKEAQTWVRRGRAQLIASFDGTQLRLQLDPKNPEANAAFHLLQNGLENQPLPLEVDPITTQGGRYVDFLVPGLMAMGIMNSCIWGIGWTLIEMRMKKLLRRMVATPMPKWALIYSQFLNRLLVSTIELSVLFVFAWAYFRITLVGSLLALLALIVAGNIAFAGLALLMACRTSSTTVGSGLVNLTTMPMMILSGVFFSYQNFPEWSWPYLSNLPLSLLADGMRAIIHEGAGLAQVAYPLSILTAIGLLCSFLALRVFRWY